MASTYLTRTPSSSGSNTTWTFSAWIKRSALGLDTVPFATGYASPQIDESIINIGADDQLRFNININDVTDVTVKSSRKLRDTSGWYHIVVACDTTQATASDRIKIYFNGELETNLSNTDYPTQGQSTFFGDTSKEQKIGLQPRTSNYFDGSMSHFHFIDGTAYDASAFGEYDANGVWKAKTSPSVTYGTNGFFILKDSGSVTDQSGNGNNFTVGGGTLTDTLDCSANVFATLNPLSRNAGTFANGNTSQTGGNDIASTIGVTTGKWYWEVKRANSSTSFHAGICSTNNGMNGTTNQFLNGDTGSVGGSIYIRQDSIGTLSFSGGAGFSSVSYNSFGTPSISSGDILGFALDLDSATKRLDVYQNGSSIGNVTFSYDELNPIFVFSRMNAGVTGDFNFGNGYFGTTAVASAGTNASGNGIFEYDVPTGYTALCTKGLNGE
jgi:hypothetical protein